MGVVRVIGGRDKYAGEVINTTSKSTNWSKGLSPFYLGNVELYDGYKAQNVENAWQFSKVYQEHTDTNGNPTPDYFEWAKKGWESKWAFRYPMGKGAIPLYSWWNGDKLDYIEARKRIYLPLYAKAVVTSPAYQILKKTYEQRGEVILWDFDGYDYLALGMTLEQVLNEPKRKMGHAFVLAMLLTGVCQVSETGEVTLHFQ
ncbi:hypothetical protein CVD28_00320 [Bacillus sp. M6-12]|uniref:DUF6939 family protein n=1 Tax=Bacillus sp. M6-12 TaxID=2054166 RepID=UPI000C766F3A|nr:hypothetical protein [Bacillus sp. M6-12]PLS18880.1 hypothetical protein CVD28_00320 [Bacillus sp. M6-12]